LTVCFDIIFEHGKRETTGGVNSDSARMRHWTKPPARGDEMDVRTEPEIPQGGKKDQPDIEVFGRTGKHIGHFYYGFNAIDGGTDYSFVPFQNGYFVYDGGTLTQVLEKLKQANAAVKAGLL
jgi:hypothetical protein